MFPFGNQPYGGFSFFFDLFFRFGRTVPVAKEETAVFNSFFEFIVRINLIRMGFPEFLSFFIYILLNQVKQFQRVIRNIIHRHDRLFQRIPATYLNRSVCHIPGTYGKTHGNTFYFPFREFKAGTDVISGIYFHRNAFKPQAGPSAVPYERKWQTTLLPLYILEPLTTCMGASFGGKTNPWFI
jgi:hypothetical protein